MAGSYNGFDPTVAAERKDALRDALNRIHVYLQQVDAQLSTQQSGTATAGNVSSIFEDGSATMVQGDIELLSGNEMSISQSGQQFTFDSTATPVGSATPNTIEPDDTAVVGTSTDAAHEDHEHAIVAAAGGAIAVGATGAEGIGTSFVRDDHTHTVPIGAPQNIGNAAVNGSSGNFSDADHVHDLGTAGDTNYLRRDGGNDITGTLVPDSDGGQSLGTAALHFNEILARSIARSVPDASTGLLVGVDRSGTTGGIRIESDSVSMWSAESPNQWQTAAIPAVSPVLVALEGITSLDELKSADGAYDMDGNTFTDLGGCTSSNAAVLTLTSDVTGASGVNGINLTWDEGTAESSNEWITSLRYNDGSSTEDKFKFGFYNQPFSNYMSTIYIPSGGSIPGCAIVSGADASGSAALNDPDNTGFQMFPAFGGGNLWLYAGGSACIKIQKTGTDITVQDDAGWNFSFKGIVKLRSLDTTTTSHANGFFQTAFSTTKSLTGGWLRIDRYGNPDTSKTAVNHTNALFGVDYLGVLHTGQFGDAGTAPGDGGCGAAGYTDVSSAVDKDGSDFVVFGGVGTGDGTGGGDVIFKTPDLNGASNTTPQSLSAKWAIEREGQLVDQTGNYQEFQEMTAPGGGAANSARLYAVDNGAGKTQLAVVFNTGAVQVLATEP